MEVIRSVQNERVKKWYKLHEKKYREKEQLFLVENEHLVQEAFGAGLLDCLLVLEGFEMKLDVKTYVVSDAVMNKLKMNVSMPKCMGVVKMPKFGQMVERVILCDDVQDPGNLGTMIRSAYSFGFDTCVVSNKSVDLFNEKCVRSTQGALFHMNVVRGDLKDFILKLKKDGFKVYATSLHERSKGLSDMENVGKVALVFGNEGAGVSQEVLALCDESIFIEMSRFESLNVAMACSICAYWFRKV